MLINILQLMALTRCICSSHDDVIKWKHFPRHWPFLRGIHRWPVNSPHKGQWRGALMFSLICVWINAWVNNREAGDLRRYRAHYDVIVMCELCQRWFSFWLIIFMATSYYMNWYCLIITINLTNGNIYHLNSTLNINIFVGKNEFENADNHFSRLQWVEFRTGCDPLSHRHICNRFLIPSGFDRLGQPQSTMPILVIMGRYLKICTEFCRAEY